MKKLFSLFLVLLMLFSMVACGSSTDGTSTSTNTSTNTDTSTSTRPTYVPDYTKDTTVYKPYVSTGNTIRYLNETLEYPSVTKYLNGKKAALSMTFDDANNPDAARIISEIFAGYGNMRGTIMANVGTMKANGGPEPWKQYFALGYLDLGCHGYDHAEPTTLPVSGYDHEIGEAFTYLRENFPDQRVLTYATPNAHINDSYEEYLKDWCITNRLEAGGEFAEIGEEFNMYRIKSKMIREDTSLRDIYSAVETSVEAERWIVHLFHDIIEDDGHSNYNPTTRSKFALYCAHLQENYGDTVWFGSYEDVALYANQYNHLSIDYTDVSRDSFTFTLKSTLENEQDIVPVGIKVQLPRFTDSAVAVVNGEAQALELDTSVKNKVYAVIKDVMAENDTEIVIYFGGNTNFRNGCAVHSYVYDSTVAPTEVEIGYDLSICTKCGCSYKSNVTPFSTTENGIQNALPPTTEE